MKKVNEFSDFNDIELTGLDTWNLVAPILAQRTNEKDFGLLDKAYVNVFCALKFWDEHHKNDKGDKK
jgi:hypothetical protein